jgi:hypothetical protein
MRTVLLPSTDRRCKGIAENVTYCTVCKKLMQCRTLLPEHHILTFEDIHALYCTCLLEYSVQNEELLELFSWSCFLEHPVR